MNGAVIAAADGGLAGPGDGGFIPGAVYLLQGAGQVGGIGGQQFQLEGGGNDGSVYGDFAEVEGGKELLLTVGGANQMELNVAAKVGGGVEEAGVAVGSGIEATANGGGDGNGHF